MWWMNAMGGCVEEVYVIVIWAGGRRWFLHSVASSRVWDGRYISASYV